MNSGQSNLGQNQSLVIIDGRVKDSRFLAQGVVANTQVYILSPHVDGMRQITKILENNPHFGALHLVSHGSPGFLHLGKINLSLQTLSYHSQQLRQWGKYLSPDPEILLYGCQIGAELHFLRQLHRLTGAKIAASQTRVGNARKGGKWHLGVTIGNLSTPLAFTTDTQATYSEIFGKAYTSKALRKS